MQSATHPTSLLLLVCSKVDDFAESLGQIRWWLLIGLKANESGVGRPKGQLAVLILHLQMVMDVNVKAFFPFTNGVRTDHHFEVGGLDWVVLLFREF